MKLHRVTALVLRHLYLYRRSLPRIMEIFYWPFLDLVIWGFITLYLARYQTQVPGFVTFFLGALILWDMLFRAQQGITITFLEELWARNLMNLFASPPEAERIPGSHHGHERDEGHDGFHRHGGVCPRLLFL